MPALSRLKKLLLALALAASAGVGAQGLPEVHAAARNDLEQALADLAKARREVEEEKLPLTQSIGELENRLLVKRQEVQAAERAQENDIVELNERKRQAREKGEQVKYIETLLATYLNNFRSRLNPVEQPRFDVLFRDFERAAAAPDLGPADRLSAKAALVAASLDRVQSLAGGEVLDAKVLDAGGRLREGKAMLFGPVAWFAGPDDATTGLVQEQLNRGDPGLYPLPAAAAGLRELAAQGRGRLAFDATLGNAVKIASIKTGAVEEVVTDFRVGGIVMWPLGILLVSALVVATYKWIHLSRVRLATPMDVQRVLSALNDGNETRALEQARAIPGPAGEMIVTAMGHLDEKKEYIEEVMYERMLATKPKLESLLPFIALTATAAPLLGLLGTVTGMISTFNLISIFGTGDPRTLSSGISEALITTKWGLLIAIPAVLVYAFLNRKAKGVLAGMEQTAVSFINGLPERRESVAA
ncbi:MAG: MotA/TolQ/ExbB proton channel family protein [Limisphaerales bacterium]